MSLVWVAEDDMSRRDSPSTVGMEARIQRGMLAASGRAGLLIISFFNSVLPAVKVSAQQSKHRDTHEPYAGADTKMDYQ